MQHKAGFHFPDTDTHFTEFTFELGHLAELIPLVSERRLAIDGGAHIGAWTQAMSRLFDTVLSFEPFEANFECLVENTSGLDNVRSYNCALGDMAGKASMHSPVNPGNSGAGWLVDGEDFDVITIDGMNLPPVDFIKLDVEGFEPFAIKGAEKTLARYHPVVLVEQKPITARYDLPYDAAGTLLEQMGYELALKLNNDYIYV